MGVVAVTGATGHIGVNLCRALAAEGRELRIVGRRPLPAEAGLAAGDVEHVEADIRDADALRRALAGADTVFHLAARLSIGGDPDGSLWATNVDGTRNVCDAALAAGVGRLVHCSSLHAFDTRRHVRDNPPPKSSWKQRPKPPRAMDESAGAATDPAYPAYARSKAAAAAIVAEAVARGLDAVSVAPTAVVGPLDLGPSQLGRFLMGVARRAPGVLVSGGYDFVDVRDVAEGLLAAERAGRRGETYLLGGEWASLRRISRLVAHANGVQPPSVTIPVRLAAAAVPALGAVWRGAEEAGFTPEAMAAVRWAPRVSHAKASGQLGYQPRPLEETARDLTAWLVDSGRVQRRGAALLNRTDVENAERAARLARRRSDADGDGGPGSGSGS